MTIETWQIGALIVLASLILAEIAYFGPILPPVRIWGEAVLGGSSGAHDGYHLVYGTV